jgi:glycosyltransferase involved in cell wall biosynthesis
MRVLFCSQAANTGGGVEAWMESLTSALQSRGHEVVTALAKGSFHDPTRYAARHMVANPIEVDGTLGVQEVRIANLLRVFDHVQPDVIIPVNLFDALLAAAYDKTRGSPSRLAVCLHAQSVDRIEQVRACAPFIDLAVSVSRRVAHELAAVVGEPGRALHIPTGVPLPLAPPQPRDRLQQVAYVGRLDQEEKRVLDLVPLMNALEGSGVTLHVVGSGAEDRRLREELRGLPVEFHGDLSRQELYASIYPHIDGVVVLSKAEAGPIVAWEAMVHGVVPIVSDFVGRSEEAVIRGGETGVVFPVGDMNAAANAIRALTGPGALERLSAQVRAQLPAAYTLPAFEESWHEALVACTKMPPRRGARSELPPLLSHGQLARLGLGVKTMAVLRRMIGRRHLHFDAGSEWPH